MSQTYLARGSSGRQAQGRVAWVLAALLAVGSNCWAQVSWEDYARAEQLLTWNVNKLVFKWQVTPNWIERSDRFWYRNLVRGGKEFVLVDAERNTQGPAFDHARLAAGLSRAAGRAYEPSKLPFDSITFVKAGRAVLLEVDKVQWTCDLASYQCTKGAQVPDTEGQLNSPDGRWVAFVKDHNLWVRPAAGGEDVQLSRDGEPYYDYGSPPEWARTWAQGRKLPPLALWSPDSKRIVTHRLDERRVLPTYLIRSVVPEGWRPVLHSYRYPMVGDAELSLAETVIFNVEQLHAVRVQAEPLVAITEALADWVWWSEDSQRLYYIREERGSKAFQLEVADVRSGEPRTLLRERGSTQVEPSHTFYGEPNVRVLGTGEIIWWSERDGWGHLYLYDATGALKRRLTSGPWIVREIAYVDEKFRRVYFTAGGREPGRDPYLRHLYRVNLDGSGLQLLTPEDAEHQVRFSPSGRYFVDAYSRVDLAPVSALRTADGALVRKLEEADLELLLASGWKWPERFQAKGRDGVTDIYGVIFRPSKFDTNKRYPVIDDIYHSPHRIWTHKRFGGQPTGDLMGFNFWHAQALAELGFIVVTVDGLGTPWRSKAFHDAYYGNMGDCGLEDHVAAFRQLAIGYPYMDLSRVGVYGHSQGGFCSARAILAYPDFYKVGVSSAGDHDQRGFIQFWGEKYEGLLSGSNYDNQSNPLLAKNLKGKMLLAWADLDDNVPPGLTIKLIYELIKANKDFDLLVMPNRDHDFLRDPYFLRRRWDYFVQHLLGQRPPAGYKIQEPPPS